MKIRATRYHDFSAGHRVVGHENKCRHLHGHNYRVTFHCEAEELDDLGRVIDFGVIKAKLCMWLEDNWDHKTLLWDRDEMANILLTANMVEANESVVVTRFNPTAENMAKCLMEDIAPVQLYRTGVTCTKIEVEETRKCSVTAELFTQVPQT